jgi:uncharacterized protein (DUF169 family)
MFATSADDHEHCAIGQYTHSMEMSPGSSTDLQDALKVFAELTYVREEDLVAIPVLQAKASHVVYGPLAEMPIRPDVVLLFVSAGQTLILSEASQQTEGGLPPAMGRPACAVIPQVSNTGRSASALDAAAPAPIWTCSRTMSRCTRCPAVRLKRSQSE